MIYNGGEKERNGDNEKEGKRSVRNGEINVDGSEIMKLWLSSSCKPSSL